MKTSHTKKQLDDIRRQISRAYQYIHKYHEEPEILEDAVFEDQGHPLNVYFYTEVDVSIIEEACSALKKAYSIVQDIQEDNGIKNEDYTIEGKKYT